MSGRPTVAREAAERGADVAADLFGTTLDVETKDSTLDYVTRADTDAQRTIIEVIADTYPGETIVGEEEDERKTVPDHDEPYWVIDPVDGTTNFVLGLPLWATSVAAVDSKGPVGATTVAPALSKTFHAEDGAMTSDGEAVAVSDPKPVEELTVASMLRYGPERDEAFGSLLKQSLRHFGDLRRFGSAQLTLAQVASGSLDAAIGVQPRPNPWDTIAGAYMVECGGGTVTDVHGDTWTPGSHGMVASNGHVHDEIVATLQDALSL